MTDTGTMHIDLRVGESLRVGDSVITLAKKDGQRARLTVTAPRSTPVVRPNQQPSAQECASSPIAGKEHTHGKHPL